MLKVTKTVVSSVFALSVLAAVCSNLQGATLIQWGPTGQNTGDFKTSGTDVPGNSLSIASGISVTDQGGGDEYALGAGLAYSTSYATGTGAVWQADDIDLLSMDITRASALSANHYLAYEISTDTKYTISDLSFDVWRNGPAAADSFAIYYSLDGAPLVQAGSDFNVPTNGVIGSDPAGLTSLTASGLSFVLPVSSSLEVRLYGWNAGGSTGNVHVTGAFINGAPVPPVPEPSSALLVALGVLGLRRIRRRHKA